MISLLPAIKNSFFGRIFLWFWLVTLFSLVSGVVVSRLLAPNQQIVEPTSAQSQVLNRAVERIQRIPNLTPQRLKRILLQLHNNYGRIAFMIDKQNQDVVYGFAPASKVQVDDYRHIQYESRPLVASNGRSSFIGPAVITASGRQYALFIATDKYFSKS